MRLRFRSSPNGLVLVTLIAACAVCSCQVDERTLSMTTAGAMSGGFGSTDDAGGAGASDPGGSTGDSSLGGTSGASGAAGTVAITIGGGTGGNGGSGGHAAGGSSVGGASAGSSGAGGSGGQLPCGDIDQDKVDDCVETLVQNSRFDSDLSYWFAEPLEAQTWDSRNARAGMGSGSILVSNMAPVASAPGSFMVGAHQCLQVTAGAIYEMAVRVLIPGQQGGGEAGINVEVFGADDCAGSFLEAQTVASTMDVDSWLVVQGELEVPSTARSMWVRLVAIKPFAQTALGALFDDVLVRPK
jgi:hypothetical protein